MSGAPAAEPARTAGRAHAVAPPRAAAAAQRAPDWRRKLAALDWSAPWYRPYATLGARAAAAVARGATVAEALNALLDAQAAPSPPRLAAGVLRFSAQAELPPGMAYEAHIHRSARVPTRDDLHDFFNGLMWLHHPALKRRLNELQAGAIAADGIGPTRGALRDALTLFDESGAWFEAPAELCQALAARDWQALFVRQRSHWAAARLTVFGHAVLQRLAAPYKALTAHTRLAAPARWLAEAPAAWATKPFEPLPVLGVPGWWAANEASAFYADAAVFRPLPGRG